MMKVQDKTLSATEFKAQCLQILDHLDPQGVAITKYGRPVARVTPIVRADTSKLFGNLKGEIAIPGDILSTGEKRNAES